MSRSLAPYRLRAALLVLFLAVAAVVTLLLALPKPATAVVCPIGSLIGQTTVYYSGPEHKQVVGECSSCDGTCTGRQTAYSSTFRACCPGGN